MEDVKKQKRSTCNNLIFIKTLGVGYNAKVKLAQDIKSGKMVAVKIIKKIDKNNVKTLQNELDILTKLKHENIIRLLDVQQNQEYKKKNGKQKKVTFIVLELAENGELFDFIAHSGNFSHEVSRTFFISLLSALEYAQQKSYSHRDLKPENILLDKNFVLKVGDWGFGAHLNGLKNNTILGTEGYMAPEIHLKLNYKSEEVDLFACAIILFIMVSGNPPFSRAHKNDLYYSLIMNKNSADKFWQQHLKFKKDKDIYTPEFRDLIGKMLAFNPKDRLCMNQVKTHPYLQGKVLNKEQINVLFQTKKVQVDKQIEIQRQKKQQIKMQQQNIHNVAIKGFRGIEKENYQFFEIQQLFQLETQRQLEQINIFQQEYLQYQQTGLIYTCLDQNSLFKYLLLVLVQSNINPKHISLHPNKYKLEFYVLIEEIEIKIQASILQIEESVNQISFIKIQGDSILYYNFIKQIQEQLNKFILI